MNQLYHTPKAAAATPTTPTPTPIPALAPVERLSLPLLPPLDNAATDGLLPGVLVNVLTSTTVVAAFVATTTEVSVA